MRFLWMPIYWLMDLIDSFIDEYYVLPEPKMIYVEDRSNVWLINNEEVLAHEEKINGFWYLVSDKTGLIVKSIY